MAPDLVPWLLYEPDDNGVLWIKFNRPERMNATLGFGQERTTVAKVVGFCQNSGLGALRLNV